MLNLLLAIVVSATLDTATLYIGDQTNLHLQATIAADQHLQMPVYGETLIPDVEITKRTQVDTTRLSDGRLLIQQDLTLTSFKDSLFYIAPLPFVVNGDTFYSGNLTLNVVQPFQLDSTLSVTPIKDIYKAPMPWKLIIRTVLYSLAIAIIIIIAVLLIVYYLKKYKRKDASTPEAEIMLRPAEEVALERLDSLRDKRLWQQGKQKDYHTELTDIIRQYISRRFDVQSSEKTSDETLRAMKPLLSDRRDLFDSLDKMLRLADLVKFAKWNANSEENEYSMKRAYNFIHETTPVASAQEEQKNEQL